MTYGDASTRFPNRNARSPSHIRRDRRNLSRARNEDPRHVGEWGCLMEPAQLHQDGAQQAVGITVARSEVDRAPHKLLGDSRLFLLQQDFRLANESEWGVGPSSASLHSFSTHSI